MTLFLLAAAVPPMPLFAQAAPAATATPQPATWVGKPVVDAKEGAIGVVSAYKDGNVFVKTDKHAIPLPAASFAFQNDKLYLAMDRNQLNAEYKKALAAAEASLAVGATVKGSQGAQIGTIEAIDAQFATIKLDSGKSIRIPRNGIAGSANGAVIGMTEAELQALIAKGN